MAKALAKEGGKIAVVARSRDQLEEVSRLFQCLVALYCIMLEICMPNFPLM